MSTKLIKGQVLTSTHVDLHGERLSREALLDFYEQLPDPYILRQGHDLTKPPAGRAFNKRVQEGPDGELRLVADVELWDDQLQVHPGGMSIAFTPKKADASQEEPTDLEVLFNPLMVPSSVIEDTLIVENEAIRIRVTPLHQKAAEEIAIVVLAFVGLSIAQGFFGKIGSDFWDVFKKRLLELSKRYTDERHGDLAFHCTYSYVCDKHTVKVIVALDREDIVLLREQPVDIDQVHQFLEDTVGNSRIMEVVVRLKVEAPYWEIVQIVDSEGKLIEL